MPKRLIHFVKDQLKWIEWKYPWLVDGEIPADNIRDLYIRDNELSTYEFEEESELFRIAAAYAVNGGEHKSLDYILFDPNIITTLNIKSTKGNGETKDIGVNDWHVNLVELSAETVVALTHIFLKTCETGRLFKSDFIEKISNSIENGWIKKDELPKNIRKEIG